MSLSEAWKWLKATAQALFRKPAMIGTAPSKRPLWPDPAAHARDFARRYAQDLDLVVAQRIRDLGLPDSRIGMPDPDHGIRWAAFHPHGTSGGANAPDGRLIVDSGLLNGDLLKQDYDRRAAELFAREPLRHRLDAIIAHEYEEHRHGMSHIEALDHAPQTELPITDRARAIAQAMKQGWKGR